MSTVAATFGAARARVSLAARRRRSRAPFFYSLRLRLCLASISRLPPAFYSTLHAHAAGRGFRIRTVDPAHGIVGVLRVSPACAWEYTPSLAHVFFFCSPPVSRMRAYPSYARVHC
jgi:hypothetical protein